MGEALGLEALQRAYTQATTSPSDTISRLYSALSQEEGIFITLASLESLLDRCRFLESLPAGSRGPLYGVPFAVKDNIDVAGFPTTAACEAFRYTPAESAPAVQCLIDAGGLMVGKTNLDQFAAGLVGTRTPYGTARNPFDDRFVPGGSSSGSGAVVGLGLLSFALGTDTAGSGRVPAHFCGCVGIKPTVGRVSTTGVVRACRALDCVTVFARSVSDAATVMRLMQEAGPRSADPNWRSRPMVLPKFGCPAHQDATLPCTPGQSQPSLPLIPNGVPSANGHAAAAGSFRFGVPSAKHLSFAGPGGDAFAEGYARLYAEAAQRLERLGGQPVLIDFEPFAQTAGLLYTSAFLAERYSGVREFLEAGQAGPPTEDSVVGDCRMERVTAAIMSGALRYSAADVYDAFATLNELKGRARVELQKVDFLLVPSAAHHYTIAELETEEKHAAKVTWPKNTNLGRFTNFVNLMDLAAIAVPSGVLHCEEPSAACDPTGEVAARAELLKRTGNSQPVLPFGVTFIGQAWSDDSLWALADRFVKASGLGCGPEGHGVKPYRQLR